MIFNLSTYTNILPFPFPNPKTIPFHFFITIPRLLVFPHRITYIQTHPHNYLLRIHPYLPDPRDIAYHVSSQRRTVPDGQLHCWVQQVFPFLWLVNPHDRASERCRCPLTIELLL